MANTVNTVIVLTVLIENWTYLAADGEEQLDVQVVREDVRIEISQHGMEYQGTCIGTILLVRILKCLYCSAYQDVWFYHV